MYSKNVKSQNACLRLQQCRCRLPRLLPLMGRRRVRATTRASTRRSKALTRAVPKQSCVVSSRVKSLRCLRACGPCANLQKRSPTTTALRRLVRPRFCTTERARTRVRRLRVLWVCHGRACRPCEPVVLALTSTGQWGRAAAASCDNGRRARERLSRSRTSRERERRLASRPLVDQLRAGRPC